MNLRSSSEVISNDRFGICVAGNSTVGLMYNKATCLDTISSPTTAKKPSCFLGSETVSMENGERKPLSHVKVGDRVLSLSSGGKIQYTSVVAIPHAANTGYAAALRLRTTDGGDVQLTSNHLIHAAVDGKTCATTRVPQWRLVKASDIAVGMCLRAVAVAVDGAVDGAASVATRVSSVEVVVGSGLYTVVTESEFIIVNNFVASPFSDNHALGNAVYNVHRFAFKIWPLSQILMSDWMRRGLELMVSCSVLECLHRN